MKKILLIIAAIAVLLSVFSGCSKNTSIDFDDNNQVTVDSNDYGDNKSKAEWFVTYDNCRIEELSEEGKEQENIVIPANFTSMSSGVFNNNTTIKTLTIKNPDFLIEENSFYGCTNLETVNLPKKLKIIPKLCFCECSNLESINIPDTVTKIEERAFSGCTNLSEVSLPDGLTSIEEAAFSYSNLNSIEIPGSVTKIDLDAFRYCDNLKTVVINEGVTTIEKTAFADCHVLTDVSIPKSVKSIDKSFARTGTLAEKYVRVNFRVVTGSWADLHFDEYANNGQYGEKITA